MISTTNKPLGFFFARRSTRRWVVAAFWGVLVPLLGFAFERRQNRHNWDVLNVLIAFLLLVNSSAILGGVRAGGFVKPFRGITWAPLPYQEGVQTIFGKAQPILGAATSLDVALDERESSHRDRVHFVAYTLAQWLALLLFTVYSVLGVFNADMTSHLGPLFFFLLTLTIWSLPQTLILWTEPDMEEDQN